MAALVARNLSEHSSRLPSEIRGSFDSVYAAHFRRSLWFAAELIRIMRRLTQKKIRAIPYKGPVLAQSAYGDLALRSFNDLDLLILPADFFRAKDALAEMGYQPSKPLPPAVERLWLGTGYECSFDGAGGKNLVELHWRLLPYFYAVNTEAAGFRFDDLWARAGRIGLSAEGVWGGASGEPSNDPSGVPCLNPEDSLLVLCLHAAKHLWTRLIWTADIAESLHTTNPDLAQVIEHARALGITRILGISLWLAGNLLGARIPAAAQRLIDQDPVVGQFAGECAARLAGDATYDFESFDYFREMLHLRERRADRLRYLWRLAWTPGPGDVEAVTLHKSVFRLYHGVRVARLLQKLMRSNLPK